MLQKSWKNLAINQMPYTYSASYINITLLQILQIPN